MASSPGSTPPVATRVELPDFIAQMDKMHNLTVEEEDFRDELPDDEREAFRLYLLGWKSENLVADEWDQWEHIPLADHIVVWHTDLDRVDALVARGREVQDPRLDERNFTPLADGPVMDHYNQMDPDREDELEMFVDYVAGKKVARGLDRDEHAFEMEIVADWTDNGPVENELYRMIGREWEFRRKHQKPSNGAPPGSHTFVDYPGPPPTAEDIREVRNEVQGQTWRFERTIYSNEHYTDTQRIIHLFVRVDEYGQVQERMAVKNQGERSLRDIHTGIFTEYNIQHRLSQVGCPHILRALTTSYRQRATYPYFIGYLYLQWAPFRTLHELIDPAYTPLAARKQIPEPFLWLLFRGIAEALYTQLTGLPIAHDAPSQADSTVENEDLDKAPDWRPVVHTDIKLGNIVFNYPRDDWYPAYMMPQMIDYGGAFDDNRYPDRNSKKIQEQPVLYQGFGTRGSQPPECFNPPHRTYGNAAIDVRADIWQMGKVMFELMEQQHIDADTAKYTFKHTDAYKAARKTYYPELEDLVKQCVSVNPDARPQLNYILWATRQGLEDWERVVQPVSGVEVPDNFAWPFQREEFAVGEDVPWWWWWGRRRGDDEDGDDDGGDDDGGDDEGGDDGGANNGGDEQAQDESEGESHVSEETTTNKRARSDESDAEDEEAQGAKRVFKIRKTRAKVAMWRLREKDTEIDTETETETETDSSAGSDGETEAAAMRTTRVARTTYPFPPARSTSKSPPAPVSLPFPPAAASSPPASLPLASPPSASTAPENVVSSD